MVLFFVQVEFTINLKRFLEKSFKKGLTVSEIHGNINFVADAVRVQNDSGFYRDGIMGV